MIPDLPNLSNPTIQADFISPHNIVKTPLLDFARGGVALLDASKGLNVKDWWCECRDSGIWVSAFGVPETKVDVIHEKPVWISFAFDQNMHYAVTYVLTGGEAYLYWFDAQRSIYVTDALGVVNRPILRMDDVRRYSEGTNDVILSYTRGGRLCVRIQRDRYRVEYVLAEGLRGYLLQCGMNKKLRFQWVCA